METARPHAAGPGAAGTRLRPPPGAWSRVALAASLWVGGVWPGMAQAQSIAGTPARFEIDGNLGCGDSLGAGGEDWFPGKSQSCLGVIDPVTCGAAAAGAPALFARDANWGHSTDSTIFRSANNRNDDDIAPGRSPWSW